MVQVRVVQRHRPAGEVLRVERDGGRAALQGVGEDRVEQTLLAAEISVELCLVRVRRRDDAGDPVAGDAAFGELLGASLEDAPAGGGAARRGWQFGHGASLTNRPVGLFSRLEAANLKQTE